MKLLMRTFLQKPIVVVCLCFASMVSLAETASEPADLAQVLEQARTQSISERITIAPTTTSEQHKRAKPAERYYKIGDHLYGTQGSSWGIQNNSATIQQGGAVQACQIVGASVSCN